MILPAPPAVSVIAPAVVIDPLSVTLSFDVPVVVSAIEDPETALPAATVRLPFAVRELLPVAVMLPAVERLPASAVTLKDPPAEEAPSETDDAKSVTDTEAAVPVLAVRLAAVALPRLILPVLERKASVGATTEEPDAAWPIEPAPAAVMVVVAVL